VTWDGATTPNRDSLMKTLVIAEKPSVAADLARALKVPRKGECFENDAFVVSSAVGHLVELEYPEDIDPELKRWTLANLPIIPEKFDLKVASKTRDQFSLLKKLLNREDVGTVVNACDAGREGELIFAYIFQKALTTAKARNRLTVRRAWMQTMTADGIRAAFEHLREGREMAGLEAAARCRSESDWLIGINGTRALTKRMFGGATGKGNVATVGRVQTPTLAIVVGREREIRAFKPRDFWRVTGRFGVTGGEYEGVFQRPEFKKNPADEHDRADRVWSKADADAVAAAARDPRAVVSVSDEKKSSTQAPPRLYDLTTLQREANARFGLPAKRTLQIAQSLYERHKALTYPRTDSRALPEDYIPTCRQTLGKLDGDLAVHAKTALDRDYVRPNKRIFNNAQISDHFAIIPTGVAPAALDDFERKIYDMVARRFVAAFFPPAEFDETTRTTTVRPSAPATVTGALFGATGAAGNAPRALEIVDFRSTGKVLTNPGWLAVYGKTTLDDDSAAGAGAGAEGEAAGADGKSGAKGKKSATGGATGGSATATLPALTAKDERAGTGALTASVLEIALQAEQTKPPPRYTEATLLSAMEGAGKLVDDEELAGAMKERGLGTPATRAEIIEGLLHQQYLDRGAERGKRDLSPTPKAERLLDFLAVVGADALTKPDMTGEWEYKLRQMEQGKYTRDAFMAEIVATTRDLVEHTKNFSETEDAATTTTTDIPSPTDGKPLLETYRAYRSQDGVLSIFKDISGKKLTAGEVRELCEKGEIGPLDGFVSTRTGKPFSAKLILADDEKRAGKRKVALDFGDRDAGTAEAVPFWTDPAAAGRELCETPRHFILRENGTDTFKVQRQLCRRDLTRDEAIALVTTGKTALITDFISKYGRPFKAFLVRSKDGKKADFEFPPREPRAPRGGAGGAAGGVGSGKSGSAKSAASFAHGRTGGSTAGGGAGNGGSGTGSSGAVASAEPPVVFWTDPENTGRELCEAGPDYILRENGTVTFKVRRNLCRRDLTHDDAIALVTDGRTDLIDDFISKTGRPFKAYLVRSKNGSKADFEFPPR